LHRRPLALLDSLPAHGDLVEVRLGPRPAYVVCHPGLARQVLTDFRLFDRTGLVYEQVRTAMGKGLILATTAARWNLSPGPGTPAARAVLVPRAFPVHLSAR
jgi:pentalenene oxygenase